MEEGASVVVDILAFRLRPSLAGCSTPRSLADLTNGKDVVVVRFRLVGLLALCERDMIVSGVVVYR